MLDGELFGEIPGFLWEIAGFLWGELYKGFVVGMKVLNDVSGYSNHCPGCVDVRWKGFRGSARVFE